MCLSQMESFSSVREVRPFLLLADSYLSVDVLPLLPWLSLALVAELWQAFQSNSGEVGPTIEHNTPDVAD